MPGPSSDHVLLLLCDQLRIDYLNYMRQRGGEAIVRTPNLDALAGESVNFEQARTVCPLCSPARASLLTGLYPHQHKLIGLTSSADSPTPARLDRDLPTIDKWLKRETNAYTAWFGKWHVGPLEVLTEESAFDETFHTSHTWDWAGLPRDKVEYHGPAAGQYDVAIDDFPDGQVTCRLQDFYRRLDASRPSVAVGSLPGPHDPHMVPREWGIRYSADDIPLWPNRHDSLEGKPLIQQKQRVYDPLKRIWNTGNPPDAGLKKILACVFSYMELIDTLVGRIVATLRERGLYDRTTIIFTADHGDMAGSHGFFSKGSYLYEETSRIPLLVKPARSLAIEPQRRSEPVTLTDVTATMMHLASGVEHDAMLGRAVQGRSLLPLARGEATDWRQYHYEQSHTGPLGLCPIRSLTDGRWKLVLYSADTHELYDLEHDPHELHNLFYDEAHAAKRDEMVAALREEAQRLRDPAGAAFAPELQYLSRDEIVSRAAELSRPDGEHRGA